MPKSPCTSGASSHQRPSFFLHVKESCFFSLEIGKATNGVEFLGRCRKAEGDAYQPSEHSSFGLHVLGLV